MCAKKKVCFALIAVFFGALVVPEEVCADQNENPDKPQETRTNVNFTAHNKEHSWDEHLKFVKKYTFDENATGIKHDKYSNAREAGASEGIIFLMREEEAINKGDIKITENVKEWMVEYDGILLSGTPTFDFTDKWEYSYASPLEALRSYRYALANCNAEEILKHSDPSFVEYLKRAKKWSLFNSPKIFRSDGMTRIVPLLSGRSVVDGKKYTVLFYRREQPLYPELNRISFHWDYFVLINGEYCMTYDPELSQFGQMNKVLKFGIGNLSGDYGPYVERLKNSPVLPDFYLMKERE